MFDSLYIIFFLKVVQFLINSSISLIVKMASNNEILCFLSFIIKLGKNPKLNLININ